MRFKQRLKVIQSLEDTAKRSVVRTGPGSHGPRVQAGAGVGMVTKWTAPAEQSPDFPEKQDAESPSPVLCGTGIQE